MATPDLVGFWSMVSAYAALLGVIFVIVSGAIHVGTIKENVRIADENIKILKQKAEKHITVEDCEKCGRQTVDTSNTIFEMLKGIEEKRDKAREGRIRETSQFANSLASMESKIGTFAVSLQSQGRLFEQQNQFTKDVILSLKEGIGSELIHLKERIEKIEGKMN